MSSNIKHCHPPLLQCKEAIEQARQEVADMIHAQPDEIFFTASGSESDHWAIWGARAVQCSSHEASHVPHIVTSSIEHPAVLQYLQALATQVSLHSM